MFAINNVSDSAFQQISLQMPDGSNGQLNLYYRASTQRWFYDFIHVQFPEGALLGAGICAFPNLLRGFLNFLDFGFACQTTDGGDPISGEDFVSGYATLYLLDASDVETVEQQIFGAPV